MRTIQTYQIFESSQKLNDNQKRFLDEYVLGDWTYDPETGVVNVDGSFHCSSWGGFNIGGDMDIQFGHVTSNFICSYNHLESLEGCPKSVGGDFHCDHNNLKDLKGGPERVGGDYNCSKNQLESLEGCARVIGGDLDLFGNELKNLEGCAEEIGDDLFFARNPIESMKGAPKKVKGMVEGHKFRIEPGYWNVQGWLEKLATTSFPEVRKFMIELLGPDVINQEIKKYPDKMIRAIAPVWNSQGFDEIQKDLKFPASFGDIDKLMMTIQRSEDRKEML